MSEMANPSEAGENETAVPTGHGHYVAPVNLRPGWSVPRDEVPPPTYWPSVMALGIVAVGLGLVTSILVSVVGLVLAFVALAGWIGDLKNEHPAEP